MKLFMHCVASVFDSAQHAHRGSRFSSRYQNITKECRAAWAGTGHFEEDDGEMEDEEEQKGKKRL